MINIAIVTATRAEYGLLKPLIFELNKSDCIHTKLIVTGAHLSSEFGQTYHEIENDGLVIDKKIEILLSSDTSTAISKSMGLAMISFADYFSEHRPNALIVLGDRYETLAICCVAMNERIPIIHLYGGDTTEGAIDEAIRHSITKMSFLHFTSTDVARSRVIQLGESPDRVFCVGSLGVENVLNTDYLSRFEVSKELRIQINRPYGIVTFHPVTLEDETAEEQAINLFSALSGFHDMDFIITKANADSNGRVINKIACEYEKKYSNLHLFASLGTRRYLSAMKYAEFVIGNSSSGLAETPSFGIPTINIGNRQRGRIQSTSIINCKPDKNEIINAINKACTKEFRIIAQNANNPYGDGNTSKKIVDILQKHINTKDINLQKKFYDIKYAMR